MNFSIDTLICETCRMSKKLSGSTRGPFRVNKDAKQFIVIVVWNLVVEGNKQFENFKVDGLM